MWPINRKNEQRIVVSMLLVSAILTSYATWGGLIWTSDSFQYWHASRSFIAEGKLLILGNEPFSFWPPFFPVLLSIFSESGYHVAHLAELLLSLLIFYLLSRQFCRPFVSLTALGFVECAVYPYLISSFLWSEVVFMLLLLIGCLFFTQWESTRKHRYLWAYALAFSLMSLQRNAGIFIMVGLSFYCLLQFLKDKNVAFFTKNAIAIFLAVLPNICWNLYQFTTHSQYFDVTERAFLVDFFYNMEGMGKAVLHLFYPLNPGNELFYLLFLMSFFALLFRHHHANYLYWLLLAYFLGFGAMPEIDWGESDRFISPVFPLIALLATKSMVKIFYFKKVKQYKILFFSLMSLLLLYNGIRTINNIERWHQRSMTAPKSAKIFFE